MKNKKDKRYESISKLDGYTNTITEVYCTKCKKIDSIGFDLCEALEYFYDEGWRGTVLNCYCPSCRKKYKII